MDSYDLILYLFDGEKYHANVNDFIKSEKYGMEIFLGDKLLNINKKLTSAILTAFYIQFVGISEKQYHKCYDCHRFIMLIFTGTIFQYNISPIFNSYKVNEYEINIGDILFITGTIEVDAQFLNHSCIYIGKGHNNENLYFGKMGSGSLCIFDMKTMKIYLNHDEEIEVKIHRIKEIVLSNGDLIKTDLENINIQKLSFENIINQCKVLLKNS